MVTLAPFGRLSITQEPSAPGVGVCAPVFGLTLTVTGQAPLIDAKVSRVTPAASFVSGSIWTVVASHGPRFLIVPTTEMVSP